jgi:hypothetical protein
MGEVVKFASRRLTGFMPDLNALPQQLVPFARTGGPKSEEGQKSRVAPPSDDQPDVSA